MGADQVVNKEAIKEAISIISQRMKVKPVRIPQRIEKISVRWLTAAPFFSEFLLRFNYYITEGIPTIAVSCIGAKINLYINETFVNGGGERIKFDKLTKKPIIIKDKSGKPELDENGNIQFEMEPWNGLTDNELEAVLVHEIEHLLRLHHERALEDKYIWNISADMLINNDIDGTLIDGIKIQLPEGGVYLQMAKDEGFNGPEASEPLYYWLLDKRQEMEEKFGKCPSCGGSGKKQCSQCEGSGEKSCESCGGSGENKDQQKKENGQSGSGQKEQNGEGGQNGQEECPHCHGDGKEQCDCCKGSGEEKCPDCGGTGVQGGDLFDALYGSKIDVHEIMDESDSLTEATIGDIIDSAKVRGYGSISGNMVEKLKELTRPPKINWKTQLRRLLSAYVFGYGENYENVWSRRNRRNSLLPGTRKLDNKVVIGIDTSGSIGTEELEQFFSEIERIIKEASQIVLIQWDTAIKDIRNGYKKGDWRKINIKGRGGTDVQAVYDWVKENKLESYLLVMLTDGDFAYNYDTHGTKTLWCVTLEDKNPPGGKIIHIDIK